LDETTRAFNGQMATNSSL
jgi:chromosome segregation ATPase